MAKNNPNRQELLEFINEATFQLNNPAKKIEDLSTGVQYLHLLHQTHPHVVKMTKVNMKASLEYENVNNLRLLSSYLAQIKAPFNFEVQKVSQKNYQQNLNLLKNLYKFHFISGENKSQTNASRNTSLSSNSKIEAKNEVKKLKSVPKIVVKQPEKVNKPVLRKKHDPENNSLESVLNTTKEHSEQIRKILIVVKKDQSQSQTQQSAEAKLNKIKTILGLQNAYLSSKKKSKVKKDNQNDIQKIPSSTRCEAPSSSSKKIVEVEQPTHMETRSEMKKELSRIDQKPQNQDDSKKLEKKFDCEEIKKSVLKKYELRPTSIRKSAREGRRSTRNFHQWVNETDEDTRYNQNLLSPQIQVRDRKKEDISSRKSILRKSQNNLNLSKDKCQNQSLNKVNLNAERNTSGKKSNIQRKIEESQRKNLQLSDKNKEKSVNKDRLSNSAQKIRN